MSICIKTLGVLLGTCCLISCGMYGVPKDVSTRNYIVDNCGPEVYIKHILSQNDAKDITHGILTLRNRALNHYDDPQILMDGIKRIHDQLNRGWPGFSPNGIYARLDDGSSVEGNHNTPTNLYPIFYERVYALLYLRLAEGTTFTSAPTVIRETYFELEPIDGPASRHAKWRYYGKRYGVFD